MGDSCAEWGVERRIPDKSEILRGFRAKRVDIGRRGQFLIRDEMMGKVCSSS